MVHEIVCHADIGLFWFHYYVVYDEHIRRESLFCFLKLLTLESNFEIGFFVCCLRCLAALFLLNGCTNIDTYCQC